MGAPTTYDELKTALRDYLAVPAGSAYESDVDLFIDLAEARFDAELRLREQLSKATLSLDNSGEADLPSDFVGFRRAVALEGSRRLELAECTPEWMDDEYPHERSGVAQHVTIEGGKVRVRPVTSAGIEFRYYAAIPKLSASQTTNWLLDRQPGLYLGACLYEAAQYLNDTDNLQRFASMMTEQMDLVRRADASERIVSRRMAVKGPTP